MVVRRMVMPVVMTVIVIMKGGMGVPKGV